MAFNINKVAIDFQGNLADIGQFSNKNLDDYSIVSRRRLEKILNNSGRCLTEDEHRWLIKRDCKKVISNITRFTRRKKFKHVFQEENEKGDLNGSVEMPTCDAIDQYVLNNSVFNCKSILINNSLNNIESVVRNAVEGKNGSFNVVVENNLTVISVQQLNININNNGNAQTTSNFNNNDEYDNFRPKIFDNENYSSVAKEKYDSGVVIVDLERIYWDKWRDYTKRKIACRTNRCVKIDLFLSKIQDKLNADRQMQQQKSFKAQHKSSNRTVVPKQMKTTYDRQQAKIEDQKKLLERQKKEIESLKLRQLKLESEKAMLENQKLLNQTFDKSEKRLKIKAVPQRNNTVAKARPSDILNRMELRALDRQAKWEAIKERRRQMEQEELKKKHELEEKCLKEQMELKRKQLFEARERLRLKRIEEHQQKVEREVLQENIKVADDFNRRLLLKNGFEAFRLNLNNARIQMEKASIFYENKVLELCFDEWRSFVKKTLNEKILMADNFYKRKLTKTAFLGFIKVLEESEKKKQVAEDWHNLKIQEFWFGNWLNYIREINFGTHKKMLEAESYHNRIIMKRCFDNWRKFPEIIYKERLKDCRLRMWHEKVQEILPDFIPPELEK